MNVGLVGFEHIPDSTFSELVENFSKLYNKTLEKTHFNMAKYFRHAALLLYSLIKLETKQKQKTEVFSRNDIENLYQ